MSRMNEGQTGQQQGGAGSAAAQLRDKASEVVSNVKDAATEQYENLRDTAEDYYERGREKAQEWQQSLEEYVHDQPIKALMIAAGVGMLLGIIWKKS
jgi:ElaB/YqjD/DUF883 family membrane-anchored ribosome-binding protein